MIEYAGKTQVATRLTNLEEVAKVHLQDRVGRMVAKQLAGAMVKAGVAAGAAVLTQNESVGVLTFLLLNMGKQADLRSWLSLPAEFQMARFRLPVGKHSIKVKAGGKTTFHEVEVTPRRIELIVLRRF